jgi:predicted PilT family ATPase
MVSDDSAVVIADEDDISKIIGRGGRTVDRLERKLGVRIEVQSREAE